MNDFEKGLWFLVFALVVASVYAMLVASGLFSLWLEVTS